MEMCGIVERLLEKRGFAGKDIESFLDPSLKRLAKATDIPGLSAAADVILLFVREGRGIVVFGDYDCDGVCASAILVMTLRRLGAKVEMFVPDRFTEGYGMTAASIGRMLREHPGVELVVTVDCGITSAVEVKLLKDRGIAVVVTDHHLPPETLPECDALVDPKVPGQSAVAEELGAKNLCGAGVAFFLANMLAAKATESGIYGGEKFGAPLLVLAGIATVVDIVPLLGQNRILVANALRTFRSAAPVGLHELLLRAQRRPVDLSSRDFGFLLGPRINAAGRMASAREAFDLLMASDREEARGHAFRVDARNAERKTVENRMAEEALAMVSEESPDAVVVNGDGSAAGSRWHSGVCGIVASRILDRYRVPVAVAVDGHGSVRAPEGYDVHAALTECAHLLERFGGHTAAGGFTVKDGMFDEFSARFKAACVAQRGRNGVAREEGTVSEPELWLSPSDLTMELHESLMRMAPFGEGNPEPVFGLRNVAFSDVKLMGDHGKHASFSFSERRIPRATWWNHGSEAEKFRAKSASRFDITFTIDVSDWGGEEPHLELRICEVGLSAV
jgi:single-stranded-DNA-specific exonuclease